MQKRFATEFLVWVAIGALGCGGAEVTAPLAKDSPWPKFRGGPAQTGATSARGESGGAFWSFATGKGIFSSPVVGGDGTIYVGSADRAFYAINRDGTQRWKITTEEIIDSAGLLDDQGHVYFGSGDGKLRAADAATGALVWTTEAEMPTGTALIRWFEGNVAIDASGTLWAGNDNFTLYRFDRQTGTKVGSDRASDQIWSSPAFDLAAGRVFVGNNNVVELFGPNLIAYDTSGVRLWERFVGNGSVAASPMVLPDGGVVVGSFDGFVRCYEGATGKPRWEYGTRDHLYASPSVLPNGDVVQISTDGTVYALAARDGAVRWTYDVRTPVRSSPSVDGDGNIYFGGGDGRLWVLNANGTLRWSVQLIEDDRNDLNASPALGRNAIYVAGEDGAVYSVPYDYCLDAGKDEARCAPASAPSVSDDGFALLWVTPFGSALAAPPASLDRDQPMVFSLVARAAQRDVLAMLDPTDLTVTINEEVVASEVSGDGKLVMIVPSPLFVGDSNEKINVAIDGRVLGNLNRVGMRLSGGSPIGRATLSFQTTLNPRSTTSLPSANSTAWEISRLALPLPTLMPSYNQIGFDSLHYLVGLIEIDGEHGVSWMMGARLNSATGKIVPDPTSRALVPLATTYVDGYLVLENEAGLSVEVMNAVIPLDRFRVSATLDGSLDAIGPLKVWGGTICAGIALYGQFLQNLGLCNPTSDRLTVSGAAKFEQRNDLATPPAVAGVDFAIDANTITATFAAPNIKAADHLVALLVLDDATGLPVPLSYGLGTARTTNTAGDVVTVSVPRIAQLPAKLRCHLIVDTQSAASAVLDVP